MTSYIQTPDNPYRGCSLDELISAGEKVDNCLIQAMLAKMAERVESAYERGYQDGFREGYSEALGLDNDSV